MARSVNDRLQDETIAHGLYVNRYGTGVARRMAALLNKMDADLAAKLLVLLDGKRADTYSARRLASLLVGVRDLNQQAYEPVNTALARELTRYVEYEAGYQLDLFSSIIPKQILQHVPLQSIAPEQVYAAAVAQPFQGRLLKEWGQKLEADRLDKITNAVRSGFLQGETVEQIVRRVAGTPQRNREDGVINTSRRDLAVVTRTAVNHMAATARQDFAQANSDIVKAKQWSSTLDTHTSQWCIIRDRKLYTLDGKPLGHVVPYLRGPGKIHFCAVPKGTIITTDNGPKAVEHIELGDMALTHKGCFEPVMQKVRKVANGLPVIKIQDDTGRVLLITHDHPVLTLEGWKFAGALKVGDKLFHHGKEVVPVINGSGLVTSHAQDYPARLRQTLIALLRTTELVPADVDFDSHAEGWDRKVEQIVFEKVLVSPSIIMGESEKHHLLAIANLLSELGLQRFGYFLSVFMANVAALHSFADSLEMTIGKIGCLDSFHDISVLSGVVRGHASGVGGHDVAVFLSEPKEVVIGSAVVGGNSAVDADTLLLSSSTRSDAVLNGCSGDNTIAEPVQPLDFTQRKALAPMLELDEECVINNFSHGTIESIFVVDNRDELYDLSVGEANSYFANGLLVSNCRSGEILITKSWEELQIPPDELSNATRASMDGQVPAHTSYADWLVRQPYARQEQVLGVTRAMMLRDGKITVPEMFNDAGEFLTLDELRRVDASAFEG